MVMEYMLVLNELIKLKLAIVVSFITDNQL